MTDDLTLAKTVSQAALSTEGVHSLGKGLHVEAATYGAGEKVVGVVVEPEEIEVRIVAGHPPESSIHYLAGRVMEKVAPKSDGRTVTVVVEDIAAAEER